MEKTEHFSILVEHFTGEMKAWCTKAYLYNKIEICETNYLFATKTYIAI